MPNIANLRDERDLLDYINNYRNAPKATLEQVVYPSCITANEQYDNLLVALSGGSETTPDYSKFTSYHAEITDAVTPFIATIRGCMDGITDTMEITNKLAVMMEQQRIFSIADTDLNLPTYVGKLQALIVVLTATVQAVQQAAQQLGGGE